MLKIQKAAVLMDTAGVIGRRYSAKKTPHMFVIDTAENWHIKVLLMIIVRHAKRPLREHKIR